MEFHLRPFQADKMKEIFKKMQNDFAAGEYPPQASLERHLRYGLQEGFLLMHGEEELGYAICAFNGDHVLVSFIAVSKEKRGMGLGTSLLSMLIARYPECWGIVLEVEEPAKALSVADRAVREKRISFYEKAGFRLVPDIEYSIWGTPMHLMVLPVLASFEEICRELGDTLRSLYLPLLEERFIHQMQYRRLSPARSADGPPSVQYGAGEAT